MQPSSDYPPSARKVGLLTTDRIRDPSNAQALKHHADRYIWNDVFEAPMYAADV
jgi:hypothetical protein